VAGKPSLDIPPGTRHVQTVGPDQLLIEAIENRRLVSFILDGFRRVAEPHDYGIINGVARLFFYQIGGGSQSGRASGWRWGKLSKMSKLEILDETFAGPRPARSGRHIHWDVLMATVSPRPVSRPPDVPVSPPREKRFRG
jgi:hypothetical protein